MSKQHTQGPWIVEEYGDDRLEVMDETGAITIAAVRARPNKAHTRANANLIAAAPDLLQALELMISVCSGQQPAKEKALAVIAKVKGQ